MSTDSAIQQFSNKFAKQSANIDWGMETVTKAAVDLQPVAARTHP